MLQDLGNEYSEYMLCFECCHAIDFIYKFSNSCIENFKIFLNSKVSQNSITNKECEPVVKREIEENEVPTNSITPIKVEDASCRQETESIAENSGNETSVNNTLVPDKKLPENIVEPVVVFNYLNYSKYRN